MLENDGRVVSNFALQALRGKSITVYGTGEQTRSFCFVSDTVRGLIALMNGDHMGPINIGNPKESTILELATTIQHMVNPNSSISFKELPSDDPKRRCPDISKAKEFLKWQPVVPLNTGLKTLVEDFRTRLAAEDAQDAEAAHAKAMEEEQLAKVASSQ
jgi:UDP-glucuronate decarboxylase